MTLEIGFLSSSDLLVTAHFEKEGQHFPGNHQPVSWREEALLNAQIEKYVFLSTWPLPSPALPWPGKAAHKGIVGCFVTPPPLPSFSGNLRQKVLVHPSLPPLLAFSPLVAPPESPPASPPACRDPRSLFPQSKNVLLPLFLRSIASQTSSTYPYLIKINVTSEHHTKVLLLNLVFKERENPIGFILSIFAKVCNSY